MNKMEIIEKVGTRISCFMNNEPWSEWTIYENKTFEEVIEEQPDKKRQQKDNILIDGGARFVL